MDKKILKNKLIRIRNTTNLSARKLSLTLGMSSEYINQVENGRLTPSIDFLLNFCDFFNISITELFDENNLYPCEYKELMLELNKLTPDELAIIIKLTKSLNKNKKNI